MHKFLDVTASAEAPMVKVSRATLYSRFALTRARALLPRSWQLGCHHGSIRGGRDGSCLGLISQGTGLTVKCLLPAPCLFRRPPIVFPSQTRSSSTRKITLQWSAPLFMRFFGGNAQDRTRTVHGSCPPATQCE